jgi:hypothetical protein
MPIITVIKQASSKHDTRTRKISSDSNTISICAFAANISRLRSRLAYEYEYEYEYDYNDDDDDDEEEETSDVSL